MCGILDTHQPGFRWDIVPLPELLLFVERVTTKAKIDVQTAIAALILVSRFKKRLPKNAHGEYGTNYISTFNNLVKLLWRLWQERDTLRNL